MNNSHDVIVLGSIYKDSHGRPLGLYRLRTASENAGYSCKVIDYSNILDAEQLKELVLKFVSTETLVFGISNVWFSSRNRAEMIDDNAWCCDEFFSWFRETFPTTKIVMGGTKQALVRTTPRLMKYVDWWLIGFADIGFVKLLNHLSKGDRIHKMLYDGGVKIVDCNVHYPVVNTDEIETVFKKEDMFEPHQPIPMEISRGCIFKCAFCTHPFLGKKSYEYIRSVESIAREMKRNYELFGTYRYQFSDDTLNDSMEKLNRIGEAVKLAGLPKFEFCSYIRAELLVTIPEMIPKLIELNCRGAQIGLESLGKEARKAVGKGLDIERVMIALERWKELDPNVRISTGMIVGLPGDTIRDCELYAKRFASEGILDDWTFQCLGMLHDLNKEGLSDIDKNPEKYGYKILRHTIDTVNDKHDAIAWSISWVNDKGVTESDAKKCSEKLNNMYMEVKRPAGFGLAGKWYNLRRRNYQYERYIRDKYL